jgi:hypothetical protein
MAIQVLKALEQNFEGEYIIDTADAYRGCAVWVSGITSDGKYKVNLPASSAQTWRCDGIVTQYYLNETGSDTADAVDKLAKGSRVVVLRGPGIYKISGNAVVHTAWATQYFPGANLPTAQSVSTVFPKHAFISVRTGQLGRWVATASFVETGWGKAGPNVATASKYYGPKFRVLELIGATTKGVFLKMDVDFHRVGQINYTQA